MMRIQYASDLHLELWKKKTFEETLIPSAPILALVGDIGALDTPNLPSFLEYCSQKWTHIFWIGGNELWDYSNTIEISVHKMKELCSPYRNIHVLYRDTYLLDDVVILGLSLWHKPREPMIRYNSTIYIKQIPLPVEDAIFRKEHYDDLTFLKKVLKKSKFPILVLSYYPPFTWLYEEDWIQDPSYAVLDSEIEVLITYPILAWICGHNHLPIEYNRRYFLADGYQGNVLCVSNPRGKPKDSEERDEGYYRREAVLSLNPKLLEGFEEKEEEPIPTWAKRT